MSDNATPLPSRRAQREAREAAERWQGESRLTTSTETNPGTPTISAPMAELPSRRALRRRQPTVAPERDTAPELDQWVVTSSNVGHTNNTVATLHIEQFPTGEIAGPIDHTGEIILTGPIVIPTVSSETIATGPVIANVDVEAPGIPRRATEALSIIGRAGPIDEKTRIPSVGQGISAGFATFLGLLVVLLIGIALYTDLI